jgi:hypothetical protein
MIQFVVPVDRDGTVREFMDHWGREVAGRIRIVQYDQLPRQAAFERGTYVLAGLEQLTPAMLSFVTAMRDQLAGTPGIRFLNDPRRTLRRFDLLSELSRLRRNVFRVARADGDLNDLHYPVFLRSERAHGGPISPLLHNAAEINKWIGWALIQGERLHDLLLIEHCDTVDELGFYRKYAAFVVGQQVIARSLAYGRSWMLKFGDTDFAPAMVTEERDYVVQNPHADQLQEIFTIARVEYGRIDYALKDGRVQTWEINLHPTIGRAPGRGSARVPPELEAIRDETKRHFYSCFQSALRAVDSTDIGGSPIPNAVDIRLVRDAMVPEHRRTTIDHVRGVLRPFKPLIEPPATRLLPLLGRLARATSRDPRA